MAYDFLQPIPNVSIGLVEHRTPRPGKPGPTPWSQTFSHPSWTLDYCRIDGMHVGVESPVPGLSSFKRTPGSWHLYSPRVKYRGRYDYPELLVETMWLFFNLKGQFAPISARPLTVFLD